QDFFTNDGKISAKRYAVVLRSLYNAAFLSKEDSSKILTLLMKTPFTEYLEQGLPKGTEFAHKIGVIPSEDVYMDAGIVYLPNRPYLLIVMMQGKTEKEVGRIMKDVSERTYEYIAKYDGTHD
ncbi:MAG: serine hydrolase, partial [Candidatus Yonathbacteria bacterium]|nr:serine hydrolase [Candidatus Yonathbacteria bacterium]